MKKNNLLFFKQKLLGIGPTITNYMLADLKSRSTVTTNSSGMYLLSYYFIYKLLIFNYYMCYYY